MLVLHYTELPLKESLDILRDPARRCASAPTMCWRRTAPSTGWCPRRASRGMPVARSGAAAMCSTVVDRHRDRRSARRSPRLSAGADRGPDCALPRDHRAASGDRSAQRGRPFRYSAQAQDRSRPAFPLGDIGAGRCRPVAAHRGRRRSRVICRLRCESDIRRRTGRTVLQQPTSSPVFSVAFGQGVRTAWPTARPGALLADLLDQVGAGA